jgi:hypothetical protein
VLNNNFEGVMYLLDLSQKAPDLFENAQIEEKRTLLNQVLSNLELDDKQLRREIKKPFNTMALCKKTGNWLAR